MSRDPPGPTNSRPPPGHHLQGAFDLLFSVTLLVLTLRTFFFFPARVPTESMLPTFRPGSRILVDRCTLSFRRPALGECVVLQKEALPPQPNHQPSRGILVKRLAGRPGDRIRLADDRRLMVNGRPAADLGEAFGRLYGQPTSSGGGQWSFRGHLNQRQVEALGGPSGIAPRFPDGQAELVVRPGHVVVLGDFSLSSLDSRIWGDVPQRAMVGLAR